MNMMMIKTALGALALAASLALAGPAAAQVPSYTPGLANLDLGALITNTAVSAGTVNSTDQSGLNFAGVACAFSASGESAAASVALNIQIKDSVSGGYTTILAASAVNAGLSLNTPVWVFAHTGVPTTSLPTGVAAATTFPLTRIWRIQQVITSAGTITGHVSCNALR